MPSPRLLSLSLFVFIVALAATLLAVKVAGPRTVGSPAPQVGAVNVAAVDSLSFTPRGAVVADKILRVPAGEQRALVTAYLSITGWLDGAQRDQEPSLTARLSIGGNTGPECLSAGADLGTPSTSASCTFAAVVDGTSPIKVNVWAAGQYLAAGTGSVQLTVTAVYLSGEGSL